MEPLEPISLPTEQHPGRHNSRIESNAIPHELQGVFRAVVCTVIPEAVSLNPAEWEDVELLAGSALAARPPDLQRQFRLLLKMVQWLPALRHGRSFTALDPARRRQFLASLENHPVQLLRTGFFGLRTLALLGYYGRLEAACEIGYAADPRGWEALP